MSVKELRMKYRKSLESLLDAMTNYLPGDREEIRARTHRLLEEVIDEKALVYLKRKFQLQGYKTLGVMMEELEELPGVWKKEESDRGVEKVVASVDAKVNRLKDSGAKKTTSKVTSGKTPARGA